MSAAKKAVPKKRAPAKKAAKKKGGKKKGRPTELNKTRHLALIRLLKAGVYKAHAAAVVGVSADALNNWIRWGEEDPAREPFASLARDVRKAEAQHAAGMQKVITHAADGGDAKAAMWDLERRYPKLYGKTYRLDVAQRDMAMEWLEAMRQELDEETFHKVLGAAERVAARQMAS